MQRAYVAGPLFNTHERWYLERIAEALEGAGYATFLPHRDAGLIDLQSPASQARVFRDDIAALDGCDLCVALLTGADQDSGTSSELGYMYAQGKPCFGVTDDFRYLNNMLWGICGEGWRIAKDIDELMALLAAWQAAGETSGAAPHGLAPVEPSLITEAEAILRRRSEEFYVEGVIQTATLETVGWTLNELLEEAEDADYATRDNSRVRNLSIARELVALLRAALESGDDRRA
jgi:nucleoside 2-deoxyribosyltransferase